MKLGSLNSLAPARFLCDFKNEIFNLALLIVIFKLSYDYVLRWMPQDLTDDKSTLVQVMAWCRTQQSITWTSVDQDLQWCMVSLGPNKLNAHMANQEQQVILQEILIH